MSSTPRKSPPANFARRIKWLGISTILVFIAYSFGWLFVANEGKIRIDATLAELIKTGTIAQCEQSEIKGYPFRLGVFCNTIRFEQANKGIALSAGQLRSAAQVYNPKQVVLELGGPAELTLPEIGTLTLNWSLLHASARIAQPLPRRVSLVAQAMVAGMPDGSKIASADYAAIHMRLEENDVAFAGEGADIHVDPSRTPGRIIPEFSGSYDVVLTDGRNLLANIPKSLRGISGSVRQSQIIFKAGGTIKLSGPIKIDTAGLIDADLSITFSDAIPLASALSKIAPNARAMITTALTTAQLPNASKQASKQASKIDITLRKSKASVGFFQIGQIPPVQ